MPRLKVPCAVIESPMTNKPVATCLRCGHQATTDDTVKHDRQVDACLEALRMTCPLHEQNWYVDNSAEPAKGKKP